jgi:hypothetical protein
MTEYATPAAGRKSDPPIVPPAGTRGPRCHCGTAIAHTPGKRPRVYCSDRCRMAAKRALAKSEQLGKESTEFPTPRRPAETRSGANPVADPQAAALMAAKSRKSRRYTGRRTLWRITGDTACKGCGRQLMDPASGVILAQTAEGTAVVLGLMRCGRIWLCPVCSATIRHGRAQEITRGVVSWLQQGGQAYLVTFTARHAHSDQLADLMDAIQGTRAGASKGIRRRPGAYQRMITGGTWAGRPERGVDGIRDRVGYLGMIRATEVTVGQINGWHPHLHAIVFIGGRTVGQRSEKRVTEVFEPSAAALEEWQDHFRGTWTRHLKQINPDYEPSRKHGVDFKRLRTERDARDLSQYIAKLQEGSQAINPANEVARGDLKSGREGNMTPFQMLGRIGDLIGGVPEEDADGHGSLHWCLGRWHEYERAVKGRRAIEWTRYLRPLLGVDGGDTEEDDLDLLLGLDGDSEFRAGAHITDESWKAVARRALDLAATEAVEGQDGDALGPRVTEVVTLAGGMAGTVRLLSSAEVGEAWSAILDVLAERRAAAAARRAAEHDNPPPAR